LIFLTGKPSPEPEGLVLLAGKASHDLEGLISLAGKVSPDLVGLISQQRKLAVVAPVFRNVPMPLAASAPPLRLEVYMPTNLTSVPTTRFSCSVSAASAPATYPHASATRAGSRLPRSGTGAQRRPRPARTGKMEVPGKGKT